MIALTVALIAFAPGIAYLAFFYARDRIEPEPRPMIVRTFLAGMLAGLLAAILEANTTIGSGWLQAVVLAPFIEEGAKFLAVRRTVYRHAEFDEPMDGIVYAAVAALGFASLENVAYLVHSVTADPDRLVGVFYLRGFLSVPSHALNSSLWGYALGWRKQTPGLGRGFVLRWFGLAVVCHALFNGLVTIGLFGFAVLSFVLIPVLWKVVNRGIQRSLAASPHVRAASATTPAGTEAGTEASAEAPGIPPAGPAPRRWGDAARQRSERHWNRPALGAVVVFVVASVFLVQIVPRLIAAQRDDREKSMESRLQVAQRAADGYARDHEGYYPSAWSGFANQLPEDWWNSPFGGAIDTATAAEITPPTDGLRLGLAVYEPANLDPVRHRPRAGRFYGISYRGKRLHPPVGSSDPGEL